MAASSRFEVLLQRGSATSAGVTLPPEHIADDQRCRPDRPNDEHKNISAPLDSAAFGHRTLSWADPNSSRAGSPGESPGPTGHRTGSRSLPGGHATYTAARLLSSHPPN